MRRIDTDYRCGRGGATNAFSSARFAVYSPFVENMAPMQKTAQMAVRMAPMQNAVQ
jgi:hypothetical protein